MCITLTTRDTILSKNKMTNVGLSSLILIIILWDVADALHCYGYSYNDGGIPYNCQTYSYIPIVGAVIGSLVGLACLIGLIVFFCCIRPRRLAARGQVLHAYGSNVAVVTSTTERVQMDGGCVNNAADHPGIQPAYPQYNYPPQAAAQGR